MTDSAAPAAQLLQQGLFHHRQGELARAAALGDGAVLPILGHTAVLVALLAVCSTVAAARFRRRLYR